MTTSTKLNPVQHHLLSLFDKGMDEVELSEIQQLLVNYYQEKIENELDAFWEKKQYTSTSFNTATEDLHWRTSEG